MKSRAVRTRRPSRFHGAWRGPWRLYGGGQWRGLRGGRGGAPFYRVPAFPSAGRIRGFGVGLAVEAVELEAWRIGLGGEATPARARAHFTIEPGAPLGESDPMAAERILLVDDDRAMLDRLRKQLARGLRGRVHRGWGRLARRVVEFEPDLVILDISLPSDGGAEPLDGIEVLRRVRRISRRRCSCSAPRRWGP